MAVRFPQSFSEIPFEFQKILTMIFIFVVRTQDLPGDTDNTTAAKRFVFWIRDWSSEFDFHP